MLMFMSYVAHVNQTKGVSRAKQTIVFYLIPVLTSIYRITFHMHVFMKVFNARGFCNPGKVRRRVLELTSQTY